MPYEILLCDKCKGKYTRAYEHEQLTGNIMCYHRYIEEVERLKQLKQQRKASLK